MILIGSTGSIGTQSLKVAKNLNIKVNAIAAGGNAELLSKQAKAFLPSVVAINDESKYSELKTSLKETNVKVMAGSDAVCELASMKDCGTVLNSVVGIAGLKVTLAALKAKNILALANKESLVTGGDLVKKLGGVILPVDSEHSAIFQSLNGEKGNKINKILLTCSGGPYFGKTKKDLENVTIADTLNHPNWAMGKKITVDSATLMNKGLEVIEAVHLFGVKMSQIEILIHRQSILHSAVEFSDGAVIGQMGVADMAIPIQYALTYPQRMPCEVKKLSLTDVGTLTFDKPDLDTFICLKAALKAIEIGGLAPCFINGANEEAVSLYLNNKISFNRIGELVYGALEAYKPKTAEKYEDVIECDKLARIYVRENA